MEAMTIMAIFRKKRPQKSQQLSLNQQPAATPISNTSHINQCQEYLDMLMSSDGRHSSGVALKIYIENFKRLNEIFGYGYCEGLLSQILNYLRKTTGKRVHHFIGMEYIIVLDHTTTVSVQFKLVSVHFPPMQPRLIICSTAWIWQYLKLRSTVPTRWLFTTTSSISRPPDAGTLRCISTKPLTGRK